MKFEIKPVESPVTKLTTKITEISSEAIAIDVVEIESIFAKFLELEVADGAASPDTVKAYLSQSKQYFEWCQNNLVPLLEADAENIKLYRQYLINADYTVNTIANKLSVVNSIYKAFVAQGLIAINPAAGTKAPSERVDPASNISFLELEELEVLLGEIESRICQAKTKKKLPLMRDRCLVGIMSLEGCRTIEMHSIRIQDIVRQGNKCGLRVSAKRSTRIVPLTDNLRLAKPSRRHRS